jgi:hypothetical protein
MADVVIKKVQIGTFRLDDFSKSSKGRVYYVWYDVPGMDMADHVHTIPAAALANYRIDASQEDPMIAMQYYLQEAMTRMQAALTMSHIDLVTHPESPLVVQNNALMSLREGMHASVPTIGASMPGDTPDAVVTATEEVVITPPPAVMQMKSVTAAPHIATPTQKLSNEQISYHDVVASSVEQHPVDTSVKPWATLTQMVADDTNLLAETRSEWFDIRYGKEIRLAAGARMMEASS